MASRSAAICYIVTQGVSKLVGRPACEGTTAHMRHKEQAIELVDRLRLELTKAGRTTLTSRFDKGGIGVCTENTVPRL